MASEALSLSEMNDALLELQALANKTVADVEAGNRSADVSWLLSSAFVVFTMQAGFGVLESGMVSSRNAVNILMKNLMDMSIGSVTWFLIGYGLSNGKGNNPFVGLTGFASSNPETMNLAMWVFQFAFAATASTIVSGAVCGRMKFKVYCIVSALITGLVYPIPAYWQWNEEGWLLRMGFYDFAGCGAVHLVGGVFGLVSTSMLKPREGAFLDDGTYVPLRSSPTNVLLGVFILWWGWFGFNAGSVGGMGEGRDLVAARASMNTAVASGAGAITAVLFSLWEYNKYIDVYVTVMGLLAGLVAITACCSCVYAWEAVIIGAIGSLFAGVAENLLIKYRIDDPVGVVPVHLACGAWGLVAAGIFAREDELANLGNEAGLLHGGSFKHFAIQLLGMVVLAAWSLACSWSILTLADKWTGLRVSPHTERDGLDQHEHNLVVIRMVEGGGPPKEGSTSHAADIEGAGQVNLHRSERAFVTHSMSEVAIRNNIKRMSKRKMVERAVEVPGVDGRQPHMEFVIEEDKAEEAEDTPGKPRSTGWT